MKYLKIAGKTLLWIFGIIFTILFLLIVILQFPATQTFITKKAVTYLEKTTGARAGIGEINITFPKNLLVKNIYVGEQNGDTIAFIHRLEVGIDLLGLLDNELNIRSTELERATLNINRSLPDSNYNFQFILDSLASGSAKSASTPADTSKPPMTFNIGSIELSKINFEMNDEVSGMKVRARLGYFYTEVDQMDPEKSLFSLDKVELANSSSSVEITKVSVDTSDSSAPMPDIRVGEISLNNILFTFRDGPGDVLMNVNVGNGLVEAEKVDLPGQVLNIKRIELKNSGYDLITGKNAPDSDTSASKKNRDEIPGFGIGWEIRVGRLILEEDNYTMINKKADSLPNGFDPNNLVLKKIGADIEKIYVSDSFISFNVNNLHANEKGGIILEKFKGKGALGMEYMYFKELDIVTSHSRINDNLFIGYKSLDALGEDLGNMILRGQFSDTRIAFADILYFQPALAEIPPFKGNSDEVAYLKGQISGRLNNIKFQDFRLSMGSNTVFDAVGTIKGLPDVEEAFFDLELQKFSTSQKDIFSFLPDTMIPSNITIPENISITGTFKGTMTKFTTDAIVTSSLGNVNADLRMWPSDTAEVQAYKGNVSVTELNLGKILKNEKTFGTFTLSASLDGRGFTVAELNAGIQATVKKAELLGYSYNDLSFDGKFNKKMFKGEAKMRDSNLVFDFLGKVNLNPEIPEFNFDLDLRGANLQKLGLYNEELMVRAEIRADISGSNADNINGDVAVSDVLLVHDQKPYRIDSLLFISVSEEVNKQINIESDLVSGYFKGTINLAEIPGVIENHIDRYFDVSQGPVEQNLEKQDFDFHLVLHKSEILTEILVPELGRFDGFVIDGNYNSAQKKFDVKARAQTIHYSDIVLDSLKLNITSNPSSLDYNLIVEEVSNSSMEIGMANIFGKLINDSLRYNVQLLDMELEKKLWIGGGITKVDTLMKIHLDPSRLVINYENWEIPGDNYILTGNQYLEINNFVLGAEGGGRMKLQSNPDSAGNPLMIRFNDFNLKYVGDAISTGEDFLLGIVNGSVRLNEIFTAPAFTSHLKIDRFGFKGDTVGNITLDASNPSSNLYRLNAKVKGYGNMFIVSGEYHQGGETPLDFVVDLQKVNLATIDQFTFGAMEIPRGTLGGKVFIRGTFDHPDIRGDLTLEKVLVKVNMLNEAYIIQEEKIRIDNNTFIFDKFKVLGIPTGDAVLNGNVILESVTDARFDLKVVTTHFPLMNTTAKNNDLFYGKIVLNSKVNLSGTLRQPVIEADADLMEGTNFTMVQPSFNPSVQEREGVVDFVDLDKVSLDSALAKSNNKADSTYAALEGITLNSNIEVSPETQLKFIIDPVAGDYIEVKGSAVLSYSISPSGKMSLVGRYSIKDGRYQLSFFEFVKKKFEIQPGGSITWAGDPMKAEIDITSIYLAKTSPLELMEVQGTVNEASQYRQEVPFEVYLIVDGELMQPEISFRIELPPDQKGIFGGALQSRLAMLNNDENMLNKQVFALLVLGRFIGESPLTAGGSGSGLAGTARTSASKILSKQLNRLSDKYIAGVEIDFNIESYEQYTGNDIQGRTELNIALRKKFLEDRFIVEVGSNIDLEGEAAQEQNTLSDFAGDISVEYLLTKDGTYRIRAFRKSQYEGLLEGEVVETGASFIFTKDYNHFWDLFKKDKAKNEEDPEIKKEEK